MSKKLVIGYLYKDLLNLYGDNGNIEILLYRAKKRGFEVDVKVIEISTLINNSLTKDINLLFMGGGPDSSQQHLYEDLVKNKGSFIKDFVNNGGAGLFVCGSYQLLGNYYKAADGSMLNGLGVFDLYTEHNGDNKKRCIGNVVATLNENILNDPVFKNINGIGNTLVGFENHGGRTYIKNASLSFAQINTGFGNNGVDKTEGIFLKNSIGTYLHGPILSKNPHIADFLIAKSLNETHLDPLDDTLILNAHTASKKLKQ